ncbi:Crp/Fnr family transcriptional regulator [Paenibacillus hexagrammi]|uniref:Crp/Fnr family transcriptional regulator n=1 Tax=Paenibacillus hexagrammi TaxID=2908839 RepID=A0ABY3SGM2_9BACL|nr:Crp/Fnr family transcriptional regulator [Paenibacillus sp. YPD9-1]UJF32341.1 Crp/Fnr family transcriptional regulator [Paenibacillus sp. YPD9-1]
MYKEDMMEVNKRVIDAVREIPMLHDLDEQELQMIAEISMIRFFPAKTTVFMEGEERHSVFFILRGVVKVHKIDMQGNEYIVSFLTEGEMFPHAGLFETAPYPGTAEAGEDSELVVIPIKDFERIILSHPVLAIKIMRLMGQKIRELQSKLQELSKSDVNYRLSALLLRLADGYGQPTEKGVSVQIRLTHSDMAKMVGTTRETVSRYLNKLKKDGILTINQGELLIINRQSLELMME